MDYGNFRFVVDAGREIDTEEGGFSSYVSSTGTAATISSSFVSLPSNERRFIVSFFLSSSSTTATSILPPQELISPPPPEILPLTFEEGEKREFREKHLRNLETWERVGVKEKARLGELSHRR